MVRKMPDIRNIAINLIANNPRIQNTPMNKEIIDAIKNNDIQKGEMLANNLCNTYGQDKNQVLKDARGFFNFL